MPYLQQNWCQLNNSSQEKKEALKVKPRDDSIIRKVLSLLPRSLEMESKNPDINFVTMLQNTLKIEIENFQRTIPSLSTEHESFQKYNIQKSQIIFLGKYSNIYLANHCDYTQQHLIARVFEPFANIDSEKSYFLKLLKHLGKRNPFIISTWDIFHDHNSRIVLFQEFAIYGTLMEYVRSNKVFLPESQILEWAHHIYNGMDFLGSLGLCHRSISPKHILLAPGNSADNIVAKLSSFRDTIIYFDLQTKSINNQQCYPICLKYQGNFQAPECYGLPNEEFDPIVADIWSYGSTLFFAGTRTYPYNYKRPSQDLDYEIQKTIISRMNLTVGAKNWFSGLLRTDVIERTTFDQIKSHLWFQLNKRQKNLDNNI